MATKLFNVWPADGYAHPVLPAGGSYERVASLPFDPHPGGVGWRVEDFAWDRDDPGLPRPGISKIFVPCLSEALAQSIIADRRNLELLPIRIEREDWFLVHTLGVVEGEVDLASSEASMTTVPEQRVYKWLNLVHPKPLPGEFLRIPGSVYGPHVTESFVDRINSLGLKGLQFELIGHVIAHASEAIPRPAPPPAPAASGKQRRQPKLMAKALPTAERGELEGVGRAMRSRWRIDPASGAEATLAALKSQIQQLRLSWLECSKEEQVDALLGLAAIFGELICSAHGWSWAELRQGRDLRWIAVLAPQGTHALALVPYLRQQVDSAAPTTSLLFNMIGAGDLPPAEPGQVVSIG